MIQSIETGRKEDGSRSIAEKIIKRLHDLEKTVQNNHGRWVWELLQNAKDSVAETGRKVSVRIERNNDSIVFSHNGNPFTEKDIRGLINQISSKEVEEDETPTKTGRFGTGFLTTHLLSKTIFIQGIIETVEGKLYRFAFDLNRTESKTAPLIIEIENAWNGFHASTEGSEIADYDESDFNTSFTYALKSKEQEDIADTGIKECYELIPYVLAFNPAIDAVGIFDYTTNEEILFQAAKGGVDNFTTIIKYHNDEPSEIELLLAENEKVSIATQVRRSGKKYEAVSLENVPKLFCDFPLIGTETFYLPVVVNSFYFNPQTERDGVWLLGDNDQEVLENREILVQGMELYRTLFSSLNLDDFSCLFNIASTKVPATDTKFFDEGWYIKSIQEPLRKFLLDKPIVDMEEGSNGKLNELWFPVKSYSKEQKERLHQFESDMFPTSVCKAAYLHDWLDIVWEGLNKITIVEVFGDISKEASISKLCERLDRGEDLTFEWLNQVGGYFLSDESLLTLFEKHPIIPNKYGNFLPKSELYLDEIRDHELIEIAALLAYDWNKVLLHEKIDFGTYFAKGKRDVAIKINEKLKATIPKTPEIIKAIILLSGWFDSNEEEGKELFGETYRARAELFMNTFTITDKDSLYKIMRSNADLPTLSKVAEAMQENPRLFENIEQANDIYALLKQYNVTDLEQLRSLLDNPQGDRFSNNSLLPVTQEIIANMGISSLEEWYQAMEDKDLAAIYSHQSTPTTDMFVYAQSLIKRAKTTIIAHLRTLENYTMDELDDSTATTILAGVKKDGREISIVARPAYNGEVIIYYGSEKDTLDYKPSELWIDDGVNPRSISLGFLLKKAGIIKFPV